MGLHRPSTSTYLDINRLRYHIRTWNEGGTHTYFFLHGHEDCAATFQFVVDHLPEHWRIIAPDWRGHGKTEWSHDMYLLQNYVSDLDKIIDHYAPDQMVRIVGHSMGGNAAHVYAAARPRRIDRLVALDAFGLRNEDPQEYPDRLAEWLDNLRGERPPKRPSPDLEAFARRLHVANRRLDEEKALFLAEALTNVRPDGWVEASFDPLHRGARPQTYWFEDMAACYARITAPVLWVQSDRKLNPALQNGGLERRRQLFRNCTLVHVPDTGHNLHHDAPKDIASLIEAFFMGEDLPIIER